MALTPRTRILICVLPAMALPFVGALLYFIFLLGSPIGRAIYGATKLFTLVWPVVAVWAVEKQPLTRQEIGLTRFVRSIPLGFLSGLVIAAVMIGLYQWTVLGDHVRFHRAMIREAVEKLGLRTPAIYVIFGVFLAGFHSLLEEYFWRWYVFSRLSRVFSVPVAYGLASLAFAGHHYVVLSAYFPAWAVVLFGTSVGIGGGFWCWLYRRQASLVGAWASHLVVDAAILIIGYQLLFI